MSYCTSIPHCSPLAQLLTVGMIFCAALLIGGCDSGSSEPEGQFQATVTGGVNAQLSGEAFVFGNSDRLDLRFREDSEDLRRINFIEVIGVDRELTFEYEAETYRVVPIEATTVTGFAVRAVYAECEGNEPATCPPFSYTGVSGALEVEEVQDGVVRGSFSFEGTPQEAASRAAGPITVSGTFEAPIRILED